MIVVVSEKVTEAKTVMTTARFSRRDECATGDKGCGESEGNLGQLKLLLNPCGEYMWGQRYAAAGRWTVTDGTGRAGDELFAEKSVWRQAIGVIALAKNRMPGEGHVEALIARLSR